MNLNCFTGIIFSAAAYATLAVFMAAVFVKTAVLWRATAATTRGAKEVSRLSCPAAFKTTADIFFLSRLLKSNDVLWFGELLFHYSFLVVVIRHLRYVLAPVPGCVALVQPAGIAASYLLPAALLYILVIKLAVDRSYASSYNLFLLGLLLSLSATGILMSKASRTDIVAVKVFILGILHFNPQPFPGSILFSIHFLLFLLLVLYLPTHIVAAPLIMLEARMREERLWRILHEQSEG